MQKIKVAAITMNGLLGQAEQNLARIEQWARCARDAGAELALFPELVVHGHCDPDTWFNAEPVPGGPATQRLCRLARELGLFLCVGLSEKDRDLVYNTQVLAGPQGFIGAQRKIHLSRDEVIYYKGGMEMPVFDIGKARIGISICYDNWLPEVCRILALKGADVLLMPHAMRMKMWEDTPESERAAAVCSRQFWLTTYPMRAVENACYAVICDQAGRAGYVATYPKDSPSQPHHAGGCVVIDPNGEIAGETQCERIQEDMLVVDLLPEKLWEARSKPNYTLRTRRPELFGLLSA
ncbi:MAG TPA: nitrilase-related carbon-nitrogen hydrolase [Bryobacteraceae bacterium]|nr:nitrilase-related carbon-nitrogen hydrolase [Bryobacteraceae bacterium]